MSKREQVLDAVRALIADALPGAVVKRNLGKPERIPSGGLVIVRDGDPGEPEITLSPLTYIYSHRITIEIAANGSAALAREQVIDQLMGAIGTAVSADRTLGGSCDFIEVRRRPRPLTSRPKAPKPPASRSSRSSRPIRRPTR